MTFSLTGMDQVGMGPASGMDRFQGTALTIEAQPLNPKRLKDGEVAFRIKVTDAEGNPVQTDLWAAVNTELPHSERGIDQYLKPIAIEAALPDERSLRFLEDLKAQSLASRRAWRKELPSEIRYPVERSLELHGTVYDLDNRLLANTKIQMMAASDSDLVIRELETDAAGVLHVKDIDVTGETQFIFRTKGEEQTQRLVKMRPVEESSKPKRAGKERATAKEAEICWGKGRSWRAKSTARRSVKRSS